MWSGGDINRKGTCLVDWEPASRSKKRGLGIINIKNQNKALLLKFLDKFYNHANNNLAPHAKNPVGSL